MKCHVTSPENSPESDQSQSNSLLQLRNSPSRPTQPLLILLYLLLPPTENTNSPVNPTLRSPVNPHPTNYPYPYPYPGPYPNPKIRVLNNPNFLLVNYFQWSSDIPLDQRYGINRIRVRVKRRVEFLGIGFFRIGFASCGEC